MLALVALTGGSLPAAQAQTAGPSLEARAPTRAQVGQPLEITLSVRDANDVAGYESQLLFDTSAAEFDGLRQRNNDLKSLGRDVIALGPVEQANGVSFGLITCPVANCVDKGSSR